ncbi:MAG: V-type ATP synthase subunit I [Bacteroidetes bacterium GWD2_45_23]|nr:MAG: V-type ATP synthase subunit I [Bacteroidetes bacterium GWC2_46_850]OFX86158.1 MAG: V-type ATP synthase subunit I [Bacteroidetes bacterium GWD2_45_23]HCC17289.1 V-type ATP synthase subunit I [Porphyromonadaceae bacterium]
MIAKMKKFTFLAFHKEYDRFLHDLRDLGMIHVVEQNRTEADEESLQQFVAEAKKLGETIKTLKKNRDKKTTIASNEPNVVVGKKIPATIETIEQRKSSLNQQLQVAVKEREALRPWGDFDPENIHRLRRAGYQVHFFISPDNKYNTEWETIHDAVVLKNESSKTYFMTINHTGQMSDLLDLEEIRLPDVSLSALDKLILSLREKIDAEDEALRKLSDHLPSVEAALNELEAQMTFQKVSQSATPLADAKLMLLQGWAPAEKTPEIVSYMESKDAWFEVSDPMPDDNVPIQLRNNGFFRIFEPIAELYMLPKYNEIDLTPYFAPFYMLFFGLSLGDIGYGLFLFTVATLVKLFQKRKLSTGVKTILSLVQVLGASTMVAGLLTGGFFGFAIYDLDNPVSQALKEKAYFNNNQMFMLSLVLGVIQILFGMCLKAANRIKQFGMIHALSTIGWIVLLSSVIFAYLFPALMPMGGTLHLVLLGFAAILIYFFNSPGKNPAVNLGLGLWDTYNMATGLLGDVLSYVRLFALGLSGGILASVFNSLAVGMSPDNAIAGPIVAILIFLIGHAINIFMNVLGAIVHPVRLTFVEFYKNAEFTGGGKKYTPFGESNE